jgi:general stress protein 26
MHANEIIQAARKIIAEHNRPLVMGTVTPQGRPHLFYMGGAIFEEPFTLYLATYCQSHKIEHIRHNNQVDLLFSRPDMLEVLNVAGEAAVETSAELRQMVFNTISRSGEYFSGPADPNMCILKVTAKRLELWRGREHKQAQVAELG